MALYELRHNKYGTDGLRSKDWKEFAALDAPHMDFVFTACVKAAAEVCTLWWGQPITTHWGPVDPVAIEGDELAQQTAFATAFRELQNRISILVNLPLDSLDNLRLQEKLDEIGRIRMADTKELTA